MSLLAQNILDFMNADTIITFALGLILGIGLLMIFTSRQTRLLKKNLKKDAEISIKEKSLVLNEKLAKQELDIQSKESELERKINTSNKLEKELEKLKLTKVRQVKVSKQL